MKPNRRRDAIEVLAALAAYGGFAATFRGPRHRFWQRMTMTGAALGSLALLAEPDLGRLRPRFRDVALGLGSAALLYEVFQVGDRMARRLMPKGAEEIGDVYHLRELRPRPELVARLALVIAPAEELFWRGLVQRRLARSLGLHCLCRRPCLDRQPHPGGRGRHGRGVLVGVAGSRHDHAGTHRQPRGMGPLDLPGGADGTVWSRRPMTVLA